MSAKILLTGVPGIGKTTVIERVVESLRQRGVTASGFLTAEVRDRSGVRQGFRYRTLDGREGWLARRGMDSAHRVGSYGVDIDGLEGDAVPTVDPDQTRARVLIIDEIGKMESLSFAFRDAVDRALSSDRVVLATVSRTAGGWLGRIRQSAVADLHEVTEHNREALPDRLVERLSAE